MIVLLKSGLEEKAPSFELECTTIFPSEHRIHYICHYQYSKYDICVCVDKLEFIAVTIDGKLWLDTTPHHVTKADELVMVLVNQNGELINQKDINPALKPMGVC